MSVSILRNIACWLMIAATPASLLAADSEAAMVYAKGVVWLNGSTLPRSSAVFPGDLIQTQPESIATLDASGSGVIVFPDSLVKFEGNSLSLERGSVSIATSKAMLARASTVTVTPLLNTWTEFEVANSDGTVQIYDSKGNVSVNCGKGTTTLSPGEQASADKSGNCSKRKRREPAPAVSGHGSLWTNPLFLGAATVAAGGIVCLLLCNSSEPFLSQWKP